MLLFSLVAFGLMGILSRYLAGSRMPVILFLSAGSIALISPASLLFCILIAMLNFFLLAVAHKRSVFIISVLFNALVLLAFHFYSILYTEFRWAGLPVILGVSFLSLQHIDHFFKVYYRQANKPRNFLFYLVAVLYFPKFFSGPVASLPAIEKQIDAPGEKIKTPYAGLNRILLGLFKKLVLAASLEPMVHSVFDFGDAYPGLTLLVGALLYSLQLYFDFSGYSDIAIGVSLMWGIDLPENFNLPFRQKSWSDLWKNWHASLTQWLWQYLFNPTYLFLSRKKVNKTLVAFICSVTVFAGMALFNGIQSGFYLSAGLFALFYFLESMIKPKKTFLYGMLIFILFSVALVYFRCPDPATYPHITAQLADLSGFFPVNWLSDFFAPLASGGTQRDHFNFAISLTLGLSFLLFEKKIGGWFRQDKINYPAWFIAIVLIFAWGVFASGERFIYMQF